MPSCFLSTRSDTAKGKKSMLSVGSGEKRSSQHLEDEDDYVIIERSQSALGASGSRSPPHLALAQIHPRTFNCTLAEEMQYGSQSRFAYDCERCVQYMGLACHGRPYDGKVSGRFSAMICQVAKFPRELLDMQLTCDTGVAVNDPGAYGFHRRRPWLSR